MMDYKSFNLKELGGLIILGIILLLVVFLVHAILPTLVALIPGMPAFGLTEVLLFLILVRLTLVK
jgi:hypothetical protein